MSIRSGVFDLRGSKNRGVPLTMLVALTTVLHYRADCDETLSLVFFWLLEVPNC